MRARTSTATTAAPADFLLVCLCSVERRIDSRAQWYDELTVALNGADAKRVSGPKLGYSLGYTAQLLAVEIDFLKKLDLTPYYKFDKLTDIIHGRVVQYDLEAILATAELTAAEKKQWNDALHRCASAIKEIIKDTIAPGIDLTKLKVTAKKMLCAPPKAPSQLFHADLYAGFNETTAKYFSGLLALSDLQLSTQLPRFELKDLPTPVTFNKNDEADSDVQRRMLQMLYPEFWKKENYGAFKRRLGDVTVFNQRIFHAGPGNDSNVERRTLFFAFELEDDDEVEEAAAAAAAAAASSSSSSDAAMEEEEPTEQQLFEWVYAGWAYGAESPQVADTWVRNAHENVFQRVDEIYHEFFMKVLVRHKKADDYNKKTRIKFDNRLKKVRDKVTEELVREAAEKAEAEAAALAAAEADQDAASA